MIAWLRDTLHRRRQARERASLDALKVRYHTFRILLANGERALDRLAEVEAALAGGAATAELAGRVEELLAVTFEMADGAARLAAREAKALYARQIALEKELRAALEAAEDGVRPPSCLPLALARNPEEAGGKAAGLSLLLGNGFPVPPGFVATVGACREFWRETGLGVRVARTLGEAGPDGDVAAACAALRRDILAAPLPDWLAGDLAEAAAALAHAPGLPSPAALAARSSALTEDRAEHSFAGQFATALNLSPETLGRGFLEVMAGAVSEQAVLYRRQAGLPADALDMAVLVQAMVPAVAAGVAFSLDPVRPESDRMLVSAVPGLGVLAVNGAAPVDIYRVARDDPDDVVAHVARKTRRAVAAAGGGLRREAVPEAARNAPVLSPTVLTRLARLTLAAEALAGSWRDLEYAVDANGDLWLLQSRPARIVWGARRPPVAPKPLYAGGMPAAPGRCLGLARHVTGGAADDGREDCPVVALLAEAAPEAVRGLPQWQGAATAGGNPVDHLSALAREAGRPMLARAHGVIEAVPDGRLVVLDADAGLILPAPPAIGDPAGLLRAPDGQRPRPALPPLPPGRARVHDLVVPLTLPEAGDPDLGAARCRSLHDVARFAREAAMRALFEAGDGLPASAAGRELRGDGPVACQVVDLGGALREDGQAGPLSAASVASVPLAALWRGLAATDGEDEAPGRPRPQPVLATRDYVNANFVLEPHRAMLDAVCGPRSRGNYARLRFACAGPKPEQRQRLAGFLTEVLRSQGFVVARRGDLVDAVLPDAAEEATAEALALLGRLLRFTGRAEAAMTDGDAPVRAARAFVEGAA
ncbi:PEP/pyruvate-binding domain-containing protein [Solidesulfovibrio sp.]|uniref:PEP/pyruvate-binding domain-containing protein n=1 Tax=Solidesulfovibrio sp. TaxID=2910990 RepID=UPI002636A183|nr:PEP/pyruvate-binding domain-containing protein [Solidesulfovibrio sp.]